jgi:hypothetical protein
LFDFGCYNYAAPDGAPAGRALLLQRLFDLGGGAPPPYQNPIHRCPGATANHTKYANHFSLSTMK